MRMKKWMEGSRSVWSCRLCPEPEEEDEQAVLEERLRVRKMHFVEDALTLQRYIRACGCSQEEAARRLGRSQSSVANRLRLLKLPEDVLTALQDGELTERHGRALLRLGDAQRQREALEVFVRDKMSVAAAEAYVDELSNRKATLRCASLRDASILLPALNRDLDTLRRCGVTATTEQRETDTELVMIVRIQKKCPD